MTPKRMIACVMAAGGGTRLKEITSSANRRPLSKVIVPVGDRRAIDYTLGALLKTDVRETWISVHFDPPSIMDYVVKRYNRHLDITWHNEKKLLGSFGCIKKICGLSGLERTGAIVVLYSDIIHNFDLQLLLNSHFSSGADVTMVMNPVYDMEKIEKFGTGMLEGMEPHANFSSTEDYFRYIRGFVKNHQGTCLPVTAFKEKLPWPDALSIVNDSSIYVMSAGVVLDYSSEEPMPDINYHFIPWMLGQRGKYLLNAYILPERYYWTDIGDPMSLFKANMAAFHFTWPEIPTCGGVWTKFGSNLMSSGSSIDPSADVQGSIIADNVNIDKNATVFGTVIHEGNNIGRHAKITDCVLFPGYQKGQGVNHIGDSSHLDRCMFLGGILKKASAHQDEVIYENNLGNICTSII
ncbi:MAG: NDP-sugar synthase [Candidatus Saganbacteria bacterium]|nr:NDP-sugar synthase [Candidatus Saganbacteria bacterium]